MFNLWPKRASDNYVISTTELLENDMRTIDDYKSRCEKAIEYIKNHIIATETEDILLNILQNGSKEANNDNNS